LPMRKGDTISELMRLVAVLRPPGLANLLFTSSEFPIQLISSITHRKKQIKVNPARQDRRYLSGHFWPIRPSCMTTGRLKDNGRARWVLCSP
jgi:hypothetical protein